MSENCVFSPSGHFSDIFSTFFGHFVDIPIFGAVQRFARYKFIRFDLRISYEPNFPGFFEHFFRGRQLGDGMGGGRNGHFWGAPIFGQNPEKYSVFPQKYAKSGAPKTVVPTTTHPVPQLTPS